jgi:hypothetical protein
MTTRSDTSCHHRNVSTKGWPTNIWFWVRHFCRNAVHGARCHFITRELVLYAYYVSSYIIHLNCKSFWIQDQPSVLEFRKDIYNNPCKVNTYQKYSTPSREFVWKSSKVPGNIWRSEKGKAIPLQTWTGPYRVPGGWGSQISRQSAHEGGKVVSPTHRPPLPPRKYSWYSFLLRGSVDPRAIVRPEGLCQ